MTRAARVDELHIVAVRLKPLLAAIEATIGDKGLENLSIELIQAAEGLVDRIADGLDRINLPADEVTE